MSKVYVILDGTFSQHNGRFASYNMDYDFFSRYLSVFEKVVVVARSFDSEEASARPVEGPNIKFQPLPTYQGPLGLLCVLLPFFTVLTKVVLDRNGTVVIRLPSTSGNIIGHMLCLVRRSFGIELAGDPEHAYSPESLKHPLARIFQWIFKSSTRFLCKKAQTVSYVTREALQRSYPPGKNAKDFSYTSLDLPSSALATRPRTERSFSNNTPNIIHVAMMQNWYKGHDISIGVIAELKKRGIIAKLRLVGDGKIRHEIEDIVEKSGIADQVSFVGQLSTGIQVFDELDQADLLILPSRQEGLPRVVIEAMARGVPCVCRDIGGTRELIDESQIVEELSVEYFCDKLEFNLSKPALLAEQSRSNLAKANSYVISQVQNEREACYSTLISRMPSHEKGLE